MTKTGKPFDKPKPTDEKPKTPPPPRDVDDDDEDGDFATPKRDREGTDDEPL
ncbi:hypothetical protein ABTF06_19035 [Acinetobacter baumannii]